MPEKNLERNMAIVLSAGRGSRMHAEKPKQFLDLCGRPVIAWSLGVFENYDSVDDVILVSTSDDIEYCRSEIVEKYGFRKVRSIIPGGAERYLSVWEGLKEAGRILAETEAHGAERVLAEAKAHGSGRVPAEVKTHGSEGISAEANTREAGAGSRTFLTSYIFIHDGARPLIDESILGRCLEDVRNWRACVAGMPVKDTIKMADGNGFALQTPDRRLLWQIQTPQVFSFSLVYRAYRKLIEAGITDVTDDAMVVERETSVRVKLTEGSYRNLKITTPEDLEIAKVFLGSNRSTADLCQS